MKNSASVFGNHSEINLRNIKLPESYYHPSTTKALKDTDKNTAFKPHFIDKPEDRKLFHHIIPEVDSFHDVNVIKTCENTSPYMAYEDTSGSTKYNESWSHTAATFHNTPLVVNGSMLQGTPSVDNEIENGTKISREHSIEDFILQQEIYKEKTNAAGTLARFVQRFREQPPQSRKDRQNTTNKQTDDNFWWLRSSPSNSSTPKNHSHSSSTTTISMAPVRLSNNAKNPVMMLHKDEETDNETARIQIRANKLLELSESTINSSYSSIPETTKPSTKLYQSFNKIDDHIARKSILNERDSKMESRRISERPLRPEDDILYQWRLSRKMELAQHSDNDNPFLKLKSRTFLENNFQTADLNQMTELAHSLSKLEDKSGKASISYEFNKENHHSVSKTSEESKPQKCENCSHVRDIHKNNNQTVICDKLKKEGVATEKTKTLCECNSLSVCRCNSLKVGHQIKHHVPPHVHDICDILPCIHGKNNLKDMCTQSVQVSLHEDSRNDTEKDNHDIASEGTLSNEESIVIVESTTKNIKDHINPAIQQVISHRLFDETSSLEDTFVESHENNVTNLETESNELKEVLDSSSEEEFTTDEILCELRIRRKINKENLRAVMRALKEMDCLN